MQAPADNRGHELPSAVAVPTQNPVESVTAYHWLVVLLASCGWLFDCMGQRIFVLSREPALKELLGATAGDGQVRVWGTLATTILMVGWATGGILFGMMSDRYGRVRAMVSTLLAYTVFSGLSGLARNGIEFLLFRLLFGLGVGGMFGAATTLVAESVPAHFRTTALGSMQALSAFGNILASALSLKINPGQENCWGHFSGWQVLSFVSVAPAVLAVPILLWLKEPEPWRRAKAAARGGDASKQVGAIADLFRHPRWRRSTVVGVCLGVSGMVGLWGIAFFSPELISTAFQERPLLAKEIVKPAALCAALETASNSAAARFQQNLSPELRGMLAQGTNGVVFNAAALKLLTRDLNRILQDENFYDPAAFQSLALKKSTRNLAQLAQKTRQRQNLVFLNRQLLEQTFPGTVRELQKTIDQTRSQGTMLQDVGALLGMFAFTFVASFLNRRTAFLGGFVLCLFTVSGVFYLLSTAGDVFWMLPLMGFATLSLFAGYSIYFPELFPTRLRGTGIGFCYNTVRYLAAPFPFLLGWLSTLLPFRTVAVLMSGIYLVGLIALLWAPETKGHPLPED